MDTFTSSNVAFPLQSPSHSLDSPVSPLSPSTSKNSKKEMKYSTTSSTSSFSSTPFSKPVAKSCPAPTSNQDGPPSHEAPFPETASTLLSDDFDDHDHKLDAKIMKRFATFQERFATFKELNEEPELALLLLIAVPTLTYEEAIVMVKYVPSIEEVVRDAWKTGSFKKVRQFGNHIRTQTCD